MKQPSLKASQQIYSSSLIAGLESPIQPSRGVSGTQLQDTLYYISVYLQTPWDW